MLRLKAPLILFGYRIRVNGWLRDMHIAFRTLIGSTLSDRQFLSYLSNRADIATGLDEFRSEMPQAVVVDDSVRTLRHEEWRTHFAAQLSGRGLEIGPLNRPLTTHAGMTVLYVDYADQATLKRLHPELADAIPPVHIIDDAEVLGTVEAESFDFLVAAHVIEHMRNPLRTLREWLRVLKPGGVLYLVVPDKRTTFDRQRVRTTLEHLILDFLEPSKERDMEHFLDYARFVHRSYGSEGVAEARRLEAGNVSIHFHTFIPADIVAMVRWFDAHVSPVTIAEGPAMSPEADEFHVLLRKPKRTISQM
jgi:SAM-dependent methyltransferase